MTCIGSGYDRYIAERARKRMMGGGERKDQTKGGGKKRDQARVKKPTPLLLVCSRHCSRAALFFIFTPFKKPIDLYFFVVLIASSQ